MRVRTLGADGPQVAAVGVGDVSLARSALRGVDAAYFCLNPRLARWLEDSPPLLATAVVAARETGARLVFPANVWMARHPERYQVPGGRAALYARLPLQAVFIAWVRAAMRR